MKIQNIFSKGIINKDLDERFVDSAELTDAENFFVSTTEGSSSGVGKNALGNVKKTNYNITGAETIGSVKNESENKIYDFIKGTNHDYLIEYDTETAASVVVLQYTTGGVLNFQSGERITNVDIIPLGDGEGFLIAWSGDSNPPRIVNIETAKTWGVNGFTEDEISVMKPSPIFAPEITLTTSIDGVNNNFIEDKLINIAYRYKYADGFYSAIGSWAKVAFEPKSFNLDYQTYENKGMLNLVNAVDIDFNTGPREVVAIDLLFRESNNNTVYVIDTFVKETLSWADNTTETFQLSKSKILRVLADDQYLRNFDNVPLEAVAQTMIKNRLAYANYKEGRDIEVDIDFAVELEAVNPYIGDTTTVISSYVDVVDYSNVVDIEEGVPDGGSLPVDQMNYTTNEIAVNLTGATNAELQIKITPKAGYSATVYVITVMDGTTVLDTWTALSGIQTRTHTTSSNENVKVYVTSVAGIVYDCELTYTIFNIFSTVSKYIYQAYHQLSYYKSTGFGATLVGDTIIKAKSSIDLTGYEFKAGQQIRINFELQSSLVLEVKPSLTFLYNITNDYASLADFIAGSSFKNQLEDVFSLTFRNEFISNEGTIVTYTGFKLSYSGDTMIILTPKVIYEVTEPSTAVVNKDEFYLTNEAAFITVTENSFSSLHSNRDVEACLIYMDNKGRKTTALTSKNNTIYIPAENSILVNKLKITINNEPPSWAKYYKFGIKQTKRDYHTIFGNEVYKEGIYRWIKLVGENKNKVNEGDILIVKSDFSGPLETLVKTKVLEISTKDEDFITGNLMSNGEALIEESGLYMKIKQGNYDADIDQDSFKTFSGFGKRRYASRSFVTTSPLFGEYESTTFIPLEVNAGSQIRFFVEIKAYGAIAFNHQYEKKITAQDSYASIQLWWEAEIQDLDDWNDFQANYLDDWQFDTDGKSFSVKPWRDGTASRDIMTTVSFDVNFAGGTLVFETEPIEDLSSPFFETPETFTITDGDHEFVEHILNEAFNCYAFGNGVESFKILDSFNGKSFSIDTNPTEVDKEGYKQIVRSSDITYSGVFNSSSNVNKLNEFNLSQANFKDDIDKSYGPIYKIKGEETNLQVFQEDIDSQVFYEKDILYNADGTGNLSQISQVLGSQDLYTGNYGISSHPESFDNYGINTYHSDAKRGVVIKKSNNGLFEISSQGMRSYFKTLFRDQTIDRIIGKYDQYNDFYVLNIKYDNFTKYETWVYSDKDNGWLGRIKFNPEDMINVNGKFFSFKNGEIYEHNSTSAYNTFYGVVSPSTFQFNFSQNPNDRKIYKVLEMDGTDPWEITLLTDLDKGFIHKEDFEKKEGVYYAYIRTSNEAIDSSLLSLQGIGNCTLSGLVLTFAFPLDGVISIGDKVVNSTLQVVGTITAKTVNTLTLNAVANIVSGDYVACAKPQDAESFGLLGYHMVVSCSLNKTTKTEIFAVNSEIVKS